MPFQVADLDADISAAKIHPDLPQVPLLLPLLLLAWIPENISLWPCSLQTIRFSDVFNERKTHRKLHCSGSMPPVRVRRHWTDDPLFFPRQFLIPFKPKPSS